MQQSLSQLARRLSEYRLELALGLIVVGARLCAIWYAGSGLPYFDQWVAEFNNLFLKVANGDVRWSTLFAPHNEHIVFTARALSLLGFELIGYWDVAFLLVVAAIVRALEAALVFRLLTTGMRGGARAAMWLACAVVFAAPVSGYNLLCGLQIVFFCADLALVGAIYCVLRWSSPARSAIALIALNLLGLFSLASAVMIPTATLVVHLASRRERRWFWPAWTLTLALMLTYAVTKASPAGRTAGSTLRAVEFFIHLLSWPVANIWIGSAIALAITVTVFVVWRHGRISIAPLPAILGVGVFAAGNVALIALNRSETGLHSRHLDTLALLPLSGLAGILVLTGSVLQRERVVRWIAAGGVILFVAAFSPTLLRGWTYLADARAHRAEASAYYRAMLTSSRMLAEADRVQGLLTTQERAFFDDPILRYSPHPGVYANIARDPLRALALLGPDILPTRSPNLVSRCLQGLIAIGWVFAGLGVAIAAWHALDRPSAAVSSSRPGAASRHFSQLG